MGCDIHAVIEVKRPGDRWRVCRQLSHEELPRDYSFFGALVKNHPRTRDVQGQFDERGTPSDFSGDIDALLGDHTYSWLTPEEWGQCVVAYERDCQYAQPKEWREVSDACRWLRRTAEDEFRIVFGFDS